MVQFMLSTLLRAKDLPYQSMLLLYYVLLPQHPQTSTGKEVDDVVRRFHGQMMEQTPYDNREEEVTGKKVSKGDYKRYQDIVALGRALWKSGKRKVKAAVETLYSRIS